MKCWLITYRVGNDNKAEYFYTAEAMWKWLGDYKSKTGSFPPAMCVHETQCIFDGS